MFVQKSWWRDSLYVSFRLKNSEPIWSITSATEGKTSYTSQDYIKHYHVNQLVLFSFRCFLFDKDVGNSLFRSVL